MDKSKVTTRVMDDQKISNGGWNSTTGMKEYTESAISDSIRKMRERAKFNNKKAESYLNEGMKTSREEQLAKAYPPIQWPPK